MEVRQDLGKLPKTCFLEADKNIFLGKQPKTYFFENLKKNQNFPPASTTDLVLRTCSYYNQ